MFPGMGAVAGAAGGGSSSVEGNDRNFGSSQGLNFGSYSAPGVVIGSDYDQATGTAASTGGSSWVPVALLGVAALVLIKMVDK